jgi:hypothetical protein
MLAGTNRRMRDLIMRQGNLASCQAPWTRDFRQRSLPTKHGHARLCPGFARVIREYQDDSSSKRPASPFLLGSRPPIHMRRCLVMG